MQVSRAELATPPASAGGVAPSRPRKKYYSLLSRSDRITLWLMAGIPTLLVVIFVLFPTLASIILSFTSWNGIGGLDKIQFIGFKNYTDLFTVYPPFWPASPAQPDLAGRLPGDRHAVGMFLAVLLDKNIRGTRFYQSAHLPPGGPVARDRRVHLARSSTRPTRA